MPLRTPRSLFLCASALCSTLWTPLSADAQESYLPIHESSKLLCVQEDNTPNRLAKRSNSGSLSFKEFFKTHQKFRKKQRRLEKKADIARRQKKPKRYIRKLESKAERAYQIFVNIVDCEFGMNDFAINETSPTSPDLQSEACTAAGGNNAPASSARIIDGQKCYQGNTPVVKVRLTGIDGVDYGACTGTVIAPKTVLTAAHCLDERLTGEMVISIETPHQSFAATHTYVHPDFLKYGIDPEAFDVGIVRVAEDLQTRIAKIITGSSMEIGERGVIAGYGLDHTNHFENFRAGWVELRDVDPYSIETFFDWDKEELSNICSGESGGPLFVERNGEWVIGAITSNGDDCYAGGSAWFASMTYGPHRDFVKGIVPTAIP